MSSRSLLLDAVEANLKRITRAAGYHTDAGLYFTREPTQVPDAQAAVVAAIVERQQRATDPAVLRTHRLTTLLVVIKAQGDTREVQQLLDDVVSDVERAMADRAFTYPAGIQAPQYAEMQPLPPDTGQKWSGALLRFTTHVPIH